MDDAPAFDDSRRLTGPNLFFADVGAVVETAPGIEIDEAAETLWHAHVRTARAALGWPEGACVVRRHRGGAQLALTAPIDQLLTATNVDEWALQSTLGRAWRPDEEEEVIFDEAAALAFLRRHADAERRPALIALTDAARARGLPVLIDDDLFSIGSGTGVQTWPLAALLAPADVDWSRRHAVPAALVTGSNGKTTTVRLLAAIARAAGRRAGYSSTEGLTIDDAQVEAGDYSGPAGARTILRDKRVELAVLETARGGILRRGLALAEADAAIVTNLSADHFGEYGIADLQELADAKLVVARALDPQRGLLVLNADDAVLAARADSVACPIGWFALDDDHPRLQAHRAQGGATCGVDAGRMRLAWPERGIDVDLGDIVAMPLTLAGHARYNIANLLGAALLAAALGLSPDAMRGVYARFGAAHADNPGRLQRWEVGGVRVIVDYAHNPDGLRALLAAASAKPPARLALVLGQAGNRADAEIRELAGVAADFAPALIVLKDIAGMERGRASGEVAAVLRDELLLRGMPEASLAFESREADAARHALSWARPGDVVVLPIHGNAARAEVVAWLDGLAPTS